MNPDAPRGLMPYRAPGAARGSGAIERFYVPASDSDAIYIGGLVKLAGSADAKGVASVTGNVSAGDVVVGVVVGVEFVTHESTIYRAASTERYVLCNTDPNQHFEVQEDSDGAALAAADVGLNASLTGFTSGSTFTGLSAIEIDSSTKAVTGTLDVHLIGLVPRVGNAFGNNAKWIVSLLQHQRASAGGRVGL